MKKLSSTLYQNIDMPNMSFQETEDTVVQFFKLMAKKLTLFER